MAQRAAALSSLAVGILLAAGAAAQGPDDMRYCAELTKMYRTYINNPEDSRPVFPSPNVAHETAIESCRTGRTAAGIPVLEKVLRDNKFTLPKR